MGSLFITFFILAGFKLNVQLLTLHGIVIIVIITLPIIGVVGILTLECNTGRNYDSVIRGIAIYLKYFQV